MRDSLARRTARLKHHPQARQETVLRTVWAFTCPTCCKDFYLRYARVQADGSLRCLWCSEDDDWPVRRWCPGCARVLPAKAFTPDPPRDAAVAEARALLGTEDELASRCRDCRTLSSHLERSCEHCGQMFTPVRSSARYCSGRCRVAAHRAKK